MEIILALIGFFGLILMVIVLLNDKLSPASCFILISSIVGFGLVGLEYLSIFLDSPLNIGHYLEIKDKNGIFTLKELGNFIKSGVSSVLSTTALFIFSILFFTILSAAGLFNKIINMLIKKSGNNVYGITILTVFVAIIAHLDGSGASTFLIAIPALLPIYQKYNMRPTTLMLVLTSAMGVMNLLPWGGPVLRVATITQKDATQLYFDLMPMQITGLLLALALAIYMGYVEKKRGANLINTNQEFINDEKNHLQRDKNFIYNVILALFVLVLLFFGNLPIYFPFMLGSAIALLINYPQLSMQSEVIKQASGAAMMMATTILAAGVLIGVFDKSGIMKLMAHLILDITPKDLSSYLVIIIGISAVPMALIFCTDSYFFGILPIVASVGSAFGIDAVTLGIVMAVCRNCATFISPVVPATLLGCGLSGVSIKAHIRNSFFYIWAISIICLFAGILLGIIKL
ncbi:SLC13 family permease [Helicobacter sp. MIT 14-3879]|uniref:SLC13 family permease n=1 Tax=Helicobacter sp. MIT 14-3879 TaxID=2040649 RepID=UPI000E1E403E|nr:SLC13 family permease [Helicobacter sp. MIT 14-3879]RDU62667.1 citrate transporter [Helicobacter sp. MIT 14-3879]